MDNSVSHLALNTVCRVPSYQDNDYKIIHSSISFISSGVDCYMYMYMYILVQFLDTAHVAFLACMYIVVYCIVLQLIIYCMVE